MKKYGSFTSHLEAKQKDHAAELFNKDQLVTLAAAMVFPKAHLTTVLCNSHGMCQQMQLVIYQSAAHLHEQLKHKGNVLSFQMLSS